MPWVGVVLLPAAPNQLEDASRRRRRTPRVPCVSLPCHDHGDDEKERGQESKEEEFSEALVLRWRQLRLGASSCRSVSGYVIISTNPWIDTLRNAAQRAWRPDTRRAGQGICGTRARHDERDREEGKSCGPHWDILSPHGSDHNSPKVQAESSAPARRPPFDNGSLRDQLFPRAARPSAAAASS